MLFPTKPRYDAAPNAALYDRPACLILYMADFHIRRPTIVAKLYS
jgi:hypothetical protein